VGGREGGKVGGQDPCVVVAELLEFAFTLDASSKVEDLVLLLDGVAALKHVRLEEGWARKGGRKKKGKQEAEEEEEEEEEEEDENKGKRVMFLNLYHLTVLLARLILGPPPSSSGLKWCGYFSMAAVEFGGDIYSLAELEHNVLRARAPRPRGALLRFLLPSSRYPPSLPPSIHDYRLNFAMHCGSVSCPVSAVPIYTREALEEQLEMMMRWSLERACHLGGEGRDGGKAGGRTLYLPKMCFWYQKDFVPGMMSAILARLPLEKQRIVREWMGGEGRREGGRGLSMSLSGREGGGGGKDGGFTVRYLPFSFETRALRRLDEEEEMRMRPPRAPVLGR